MLEGILLWFLRLFPRFRALESRNAQLEAEIREAASARVRAEDEAVYWRQHSDELERRLEDSHKREIEVREMMADFIAQQRWGITVFRRGPQLPPDSPTPAPIPTSRVQARHLVNLKNKERLRQLLEREATE